MRRLIVHIGTAKTGSTSIQSFLRAARPHAAETGVYVPTTGGRPGRAQLNFGRELLGNRRFQPELGSFPELAEELAGATFDVAVVSAENLWQCPPAAAERFLEIARQLDLEPEMVVYLRPQREFLDALYSEAVKSGYVTQPFRAFVDDYLERPFTDYAATLEHWREYRQIVRRYGGDVISDFLAATGLEERLSHIKRRKRLNARFSAEAMEAIRDVISEMQRAGQSQPAREQRAQCLRATLPRDGAPYTALTPEMIERIDAAVAERNRPLAERYGIEFEPAAPVRRSRPEPRRNGGPHRPSPYETAILLADLPRRSRAGRAEEPRWRVSRQTVATLAGRRVATDSFLQAVSEELVALGYVLVPVGEELALFAAEAATAWPRIEDDALQPERRALEQGDSAMFRALVDATEADLVDPPAPRTDDEEPAAEAIPDEP